MSESGFGPIISADSHVIEDPHLWERRLPAKFSDRAPVFPERAVGQQFQAHPGGWDPVARVEEMAVDGVIQEVLYPSLTMNLFGMPDVPLQEACLAVYNDWLIEYCSAAPTQLFGIGALCTYEIDHAIAELERCKQAGLVGAAVWEVPPDDLGFSTDHYEPLWSAAEDLSMPISIHSLTGVPYPYPRSETKIHRLQKSTRHANSVVFETANALSDLITSGVLVRHPRLRLVFVESEVSWIPFCLARYDVYYERYHHQPPEELILEMAPSEYFRRQISATFFNDRTLGALLSSWGVESCMWSNDYPHPNSTWPNSHAVIERDLGHLSAADQHRLLVGNVTDLYGLPPVAAGATTATAGASAR